ncbi:MAG: cation diffusion facilitator family transporter [Alphaproteobacteria bacterium]|nr:cation diffusion facilitator family transporter [Alphaproteobacteria bacterium]
MPGTNNALKIRAALASASMALVLLAMKTFAVYRTGSVAMLGSLADTGLDVLTSLITLFGVHFAAQPADGNHRYGHGKAEALVALFQVIVIVGSGISIGWMAILHLLEGGAQTANPEYGIGVSAVAIVMTLALVLYQRSVVRRTGSVAIHADNVHYQADLMINIAVVIAIIIDQYLGWHRADPLFGLLIAVWLIYGAATASLRAFHELMDHEWPEADREAFIRVAEQHAEIQGIHDVRTRTSGATRFIQFNVWADPDKTLREVHDVMDEVESRLMRAFPDTEVMIHPEPGYAHAHSAIQQGH